MLPSPVVLTVGHSNRSLDSFLRILASHGVRRLADVRRFPASQRHPHFDRDRLVAALAPAGVAYRHFEALGGRREEAPDSLHTALPPGPFRAYADHMDTAAFREALEALLAFARAEPTAALCAEADPARCHRSLLADTLLARGARVQHLLAEATARDHALPGFARILGDRVRYDGGTLPMNFG